MDSLSDLINPEALIQTFGLLGVLFIIFAETGLLVGFFLPGDSLLFVAGVAASGAATEIVGTRLPLPMLLIGTAICAISGAQVGHYIGVKAGPHLFSRPDSRFFKREYVEKAEYYFDKFGPAKAVVLARFIPIVRTFLNPVTGVLEMPSRTFFVWNVVGGLLWTQGIILLGYHLGDSLAGSIDAYLLPVVGLIILISIMPMVVEVVRHRRQNSRARTTNDPRATVGEREPTADGSSAHSDR